MALNPVSLGIGGALSLAGMAYSAIKGGKANDANEALISKQEEENEAWYNNNRDYMNTVQGKSAVEQAREAYEDRAKRDAHTAAVTGATAETEIAQKTAQNEGYNDVIRTIAAQGSQHARQNEGIYRQTLSNLYNQKMQLNMQKANNAANMGANIGNLMSTAAYAGLFNKKE